MQTIEIFPWRIFYDYDATYNAYAQIPRGDSEECDCDMCRNFVEVREKIYPEQALQIFNKLGVNYKKEAEVYHTHRIKPGLHSYGGGFHLVGKIEFLDTSYKPSDNQLTFKLVKLNDLFAWFFLSHNMSPHHEAFKNQELIQIAFDAKVPWVLQTKEPE